MLKVHDARVDRGPHRALDGVSLAVNRGEIVTVLGPNGAGKSTLLLTISGLLRCSPGEVLLDDRPIHHLSAMKIARRRVIHCPEGRRLFQSMTIAENLKIGAMCRRRPWQRLTSEVDELTHLFPILKERWSQACGTLSGGEQQMVALARSLLAAPKVLLLDEPALGLSPRYVHRVFSILPTVAARGTAVLLVEQNLQAALGVASRGYLLKRGRFVMEGSASQLGAQLRGSGLLELTDHRTTAHLQENSR